MKLRCIRDTWGPGGKITVGRIYDFDKISERAENEDAYVGSISSYYIKDDNGDYKYFQKDCFVTIQQERQNKLEKLGI